MTVLVHCQKTKWFVKPNAFEGRKKDGVYPVFKVNWLHEFICFLLSNITIQRCSPFYAKPSFVSGGTRTPAAFGSSKAARFDWRHTKMLGVSRVRSQTGLFLKGRKFTASVLQCWLSTVYGDILSTMIHIHFITIQGVSCFLVDKNFRIFFVLCKILLTLHILLEW